METITISFKRYTELLLLARSIEKTLNSLNLELIQNDVSIEDCKRKMHILQMDSTGLISQLTVA